MSLQSYYEESYQSEKGRTPRDLLLEVTSTSKGLYHYVLETKDKFLHHFDWQGLRVLELGSGRGGLGLGLARLGAAVTLVDFSPSAMEQARRIFTQEGLGVTTVVGDVTHPDLKLGQQFDLIVDSHLLHCLTTDPDRSSYYQLIQEHLTPEGIFVCESMVHRKKLFVPDGFMFDQNNILWQMFGKWTPVRKILDSLDLEKEIQNANFNIVYFFYYGQFAFVPHRSFMEIPSEVLPAAVRFAFKKETALVG